jgi:hypothetical protein
LIASFVPCFFRSNAWLDYRRKQKTRTGEEGVGVTFFGGDTMRVLLFSIAFEERVQNHSQQQAGEQNTEPSAKRL